MKCKCGFSSTLGTDWKFKWKWREEFKFKIKKLYPRKSLIGCIWRRHFPCLVHASWIHMLYLLALNPWMTKFDSKNFVCLFSPWLCLLYCTVIIYVQMGLEKTHLNLFTNIKFTSLTNIYKVQKYKIKKMNILLSMKHMSWLASSNPSRNVVFLLIFFSIIHALVVTWVWLVGRQVSPFMRVHG